MNLKGFFVTTLSQALDLTIATPEDVLRHVTPELLAQHLPRPLWARLLTACMGASRVDAQLVVETIGVPNLCEHIPISVIWACINDIAQRTLGQEPVVMLTAPAAKSQPTVVPLAMTPPPPAEPKAATPSAPVAVGPSIPAPGAAQSLSDVVAALEAEDRASAPARGRSPTQQRYRQSNTGIGRLAAANAAAPTSPASPASPASSTATRRPQASASPPDSAPGSVQARPRRGQTEADAYDLETEVGKDDWKAALAVEDEQLVDWSASEETVTASSDTDGFRKR